MKIKRRDVSEVFRNMISLFKRAKNPQVEYKLVVNHSVENFNRDITIMLSNGWLLAGAHGVVIFENGEKTYSQALVRDK